MNSLKVFATITLLLLTSCASIEKTVNSSEPLDNESAYIAGKFTRTDSGGFAFVLVNQSTGKEYNFPLGSDSALPTDVKNQVLAIKVPGGVYSVAYWFSYGTLTKESSAKHPINSFELSSPFLASSGGVVFLGDYLIKTKYLFQSIKSQKISESQAKQDFIEAYPLLDKLEFFCHYC